MFLAKSTQNAFAGGSAHAATQKTNAQNAFFNSILESKGAPDPAQSPATQKTNAQSAFFYSILESKGAPDPAQSPYALHLF